MEYSSTAIVVISLGGCFITLLIAYFLGKAMAPKAGEAESREIPQ